jgi:enterochelin esterase-like enzyme
VFLEMQCMVPSMIYFTGFQIECFMKQRIYFLFLNFFLSIPVLHASDSLFVMESLVMKSKLLGIDVKYSIVLPPEYYNSLESYPVVYLLHGLGDDETSWLEYGQISQIAGKLTRDGEIVPMIFVIPQGFRNYYVNDYAGKFPYQDMFIKELIPFIDGHYRTLSGPKERATMGYSMGGFGALVLPFLHPETISTCVPLSISIRTDDQYMTEDSSEWNQQWGRLFGGVGIIGKERITECYKKNCPFHLIEGKQAEKLKDLNIYIDNGDDEETLCRSNEDLHILMRRNDIRHEFRVRNGGHEFSYWKEALPNALRFISDAFEGKKYRGDEKPNSFPIDSIPIIQETCKAFNQECIIQVPEEYHQTNRAYPIIFFSGDFKINERVRIGQMVQNLTGAGKLPPLILAFVPELKMNFSSQLLPTLENNFRIRKGFRFRALICYGDVRDTDCELMLQPETFTCLSLCGAEKISEKYIRSAQDMDWKNLKRSWYFFDAPDKGSQYGQYGEIHMLLKDKGFYHEYRVREGAGGFDWFLTGMNEVLFFTVKKIYK